VAADEVAVVDELAAVPVPGVGCVGVGFVPDACERPTVVVSPVPVPAVDPDPQALSASTPRTAANARRLRRKDIMSEPSGGRGYCRPSRASRTRVTASGKTTAMTERNCSVCCSVVP
jgi:hypothetical protein